MLRVEINGRTVDEGAMPGVPGGPVGSVEWLRRNLEAYALSLRPRQLVLTGTPLGLYPVRPGDAVRVTAERLGSVPFPPRLREGGYGGEVVCRHGRCALPFPFDAI